MKNIFVGIYGIYNSTFIEDASVEAWFLHKEDAEKAIKYTRTYHSAARPIGADFHANILTILDKAEERDPLFEMLKRNPQQYRTEIAKLEKELLTPLEGTTKIEIPAFYSVYAQTNDEGGGYLVGRYSTIEVAKEVEEVSKKFGPSEIKTQIAQTFKVYPTFEAYMDHQAALQRDFENSRRR